MHSDQTMERSAKIEPKLDVVAECREFVALAKSIVGPGRMRRLYRSSTARSLFDVATDFAMIGLAIRLAERSLWFLPLTLLVLGNRQRALMNLLHEGSHGGLSPLKPWNERILSVLLAPPLLVDLVQYRKAHVLHHKYPGVEGLDPNLLHVAVIDEPFWTSFRKLVLDRKLIPVILLGYLTTAGWRARLTLGAYWVVTVLLLETFFGMQTVVLVLLSWWAARIVVYHPLTVFREICDHGGGQTGTIDGYTRNMTSDTLLSALFHPHTNGFHLLHHYLPAISYQKIRTLHSLLLSSERYREMCHCRQYFGSGRDTLTVSVGTGISRRALS
jgi:fatty acid desaturase